MNPTTGLKVLPARVIASPISAMNIAGMKQIKIIPSATKTFYFLDMPLSFQNNSSTVSLVGKTHSGEAVNTAKNKAKLP